MRASEHESADGCRIASATIRSATAGDGLHGVGVGTGGGERRTEGSRGIRSAGALPGGEGAGDGRGMELIGRIASDGTATLRQFEMRLEPAALPREQRIVKFVVGGLPQFAAAIPIDEG